LRFNRIDLNRGERIGLNRDLAGVYKVETSLLIMALGRNRVRFLDDFMFELAKNELESWRYQFGTSKGKIKGLRYKPLAFTEQHVAVLPSENNGQLTTNH
jgi:hypothetical protein